VDVLEDINGNLKNKTRMLRIEKLNTKSKVYDITVEDNHNFYANDILVHNCSEIMEYTDADTTAICTLSSFPVQNLYADGKFQWKEFQKVITRSVTALNKVIDENKYTNPEGEKGGKEQRALGLGIQGLADLFHKMKISFTSPEAFQMNKDIYEALYYFSLRASCDISKKEFIKYCKKNDLDVETTAIGDLDKDIQERITYKGFKGSPFSKGILQYDMWGKTDEVESTSDFKWAELKADIVKYGIRNSLLTTQMPTATSASILGSSESFEPHTTNLSKRRVKERQYIIINRYMQEELQEMGWWSDWLKDQIILEDGSVQSITALPKEFRERFRTVWEIPQKDIVQMSIDRGVFIDQSQSLNISMKEPTLSKVSSCLFFGWRNGLKTGSYYTHTRAISTGAKHLAVDLTTSSKSDNQLKYENDGIECENCSS
jgi:ribonucleotide reductase alpha subunit